MCNSDLIEDGTTFEDFGQSPASGSVSGHWNDFEDVGQFSADSGSGSWNGVDLIEDGRLSASLNDGPAPRRNYKRTTMRRYYDTATGECVTSTGLADLAEITGPPRSYSRGPRDRTEDGRGISTLGCTRTPVLGI